MHSPAHIARSSGVDKISATILAPYRGGLEYIERTSTFNCTKDKDEDKNEEKLKRSRKRIGKKNVWERRRREANRTKNWFRNEKNRIIEE